MQMRAMRQTTGQSSRAMMVTGSASKAHPTTEKKQSLSRESNDSLASGAEHPMADSFEHARLHRPRQQPAPRILRECVVVDSSSANSVDGPKTVRTTR